jgi:Ala-tRNA(Pro) deacylase
MSGSAWDPMVGGTPSDPAAFANLAALYLPLNVRATTQVTVAADAPSSTTCGGGEDATTNAKLMEMLSQKLGQPGGGGRWSTSTHEAVRTSEEAAQMRGATLASGAKAMLLSTKPSDEFVLAVISASEKMDSKAFKKAGGFKSTKFATEDEVFSLTGCRPGAVPPFGSLWGVRTFVDASLMEQGKTINFNSGLKTHSVHMGTADFLAVEGATVASFRM